MASKAVLSAMDRRAIQTEKSAVWMKWFLDEKCDKIALTMRNRMRIATSYLRDRVVKNISRPVTKTPTMRIATRTVGGVTRAKGTQYTKVTDRSVAGEFPKADTTQLLKTIIEGVFDEAPGIVNGFVGTPLSYGMILEMRMNREFLTRTLSEERETIDRILAGPIA